MNKRDYLFSLLNLIDVEPKMVHFRDRKRIQKLVYLIQEFSIDLGFDDFNWYLQGTYSPSLTSTIYDVIERSEGYIEIEFPVHIKKKINKFIDKLGSAINSVSELELLASIEYILKHSKIPKINRSERYEEIIRKIKKDKPQFSRSQIKSAWEKLEEIRN